MSRGGSWRARAAAVALAAQVLLQPWRPAPGLASDQVPALAPQAQATAGEGGAAERAPAARSGRIEIVAHAPPDMVLVPGGGFSMGPSDDELLSLSGACTSQLGIAGAQCPEDLNLKLSAREVHVSTFAIDRHEVTAAAYRGCVRAGACDVAALVAGDERYIRDDWPMVNVTWREAAAYCAWAGKRLPTEAEWEKAARGTGGRRWPWGNHPRADGGNFGRSESRIMQQTRWLVLGTGPLRVPPELVPDDRDGYPYLAPPGALRWSASPYGVLDMAGNVSEWVQDYFSMNGYQGLSRFDPVRDVPDERGHDLRGVRGGSWIEPRFFGRTYYRRAADPDQRAAHVGFRCARSVD